MAYYPFDYSNSVIRVVFFSLLLFSYSCTSTDLPKNKVIVVHARGASHPMLLEYLSTIEGKSFLKEALAEGSLKKLHPIMNAVTICNIASFETGALPAEHGILGHTFAFSEDKKLNPTSGFAQRFERASFWEQADKNGKMVLNVGALTLHGQTETHTNVDCLAQGEAISAGNFVEIIPASNSSSTDKILRYTDIEYEQEIKLTTNSSSSVFIYRKNNPTTDQLIIDQDVNFENGILGAIKNGDWLELNQGTAKGLKEAFRIKWIGDQNDTLKLYVRSSFINRGYPQQFLEKIDSELGPSKGWPSIPAFSSGQIKASTLVEEINTELDFVMKVFSHAAPQKNYDLIMIDYPIMDRYGHAFLQLKASSKEIQGYFQEGFQRMDKDFALIQQYADENGYELIINSGHGFSPIHTAINVNKLLQNNGINSNMESSGWQAIGMPGKVSAHIYINPNIDSEPKQELIEKINSLFQNLSQTGSEEILVEKIYAKDELTEIGMNHTNAGDLFILLKPGYTFHPALSTAGPIFSTPTFKGDHGYSLKHADSFGIFYSKESCEPCQTTDVAPMILKYLGIE